MTTCPTCLRNLAAKSEAQLNLRMKKMKASPSVKVFPCTKCGGTEWALTRESIPPYTIQIEINRKGWLQRLWKKLKRTLQSRL